jgi:pimeloyl-ACP methyl ester carboxylesterase
MPSIKVNDIEVYCETAGSGPHLTLVMGMGCSARQWQWMAPVFEQSFTVIAFDNRDAGRTGRQDITYTTEQFADDIYALLTSLGVSKTHLFGISVGGMIAQRFVLKYPGMVDRLVLGCTMPGFFHLPPAPDDLAIMQEAQAAPFEEGVDKMMQLFLTQTFMKEHPKQATRLKEIMMIEKQEQGIEALYRQLGAAMSHDTVSDVKNITAPTLIITGTADPMAPAANAHFLHGQISGSRLVEIPGGYHAFWVEHCREACRIIADFLKN